MAEDWDGENVDTAEGWDRFIGYPEDLFEAIEDHSARTHRKEVLYMCSACQRMRDAFPEAVRSTLDWAEEQADHHRPTCKEPVHIDDLEQLSQVLPEDSIEQKLVWELRYLVLILWWGCDDDGIRQSLPDALEHAVWLRHAPRPATFAVPFDQLPAPVRAERAAHCDLVRDIFGNPHRPSTFASEWRTSTVVSLTRQMYDEREFGPMPILADALQDAGCADENILSHCRGPGPHVRGCWVVDLVLGKE